MSLIGFQSWKSSIDIDHLSLYIKTWFAFLSTVQKMYPDKITDSGDGSVMNAYKENLTIPMSFNEIMLPQIKRIHKIGYSVIERDVPKVFFSNFYNLNKEYSFLVENQLKKYKLENGNRVYFTSSLKIEYKDVVDGIGNPNLLFTIKSSDPRFHENLNCYHLCLNILLKELIDPQELEPQYVRKRRFLNRDTLIEYFIQKLTTSLYDQVLGIADLDIEDIEERKGYCNGLIVPLIQLFRQRFEMKELFSFLPLEDFPNNFKVENNQLKILNWFISFNYNIRNLLFHSIINPFDSDWLELFKSSYLALRELVEHNISRIDEKALIQK